MRALLVLFLCVIIESSDVAGNAQKTYREVTPYSYPWVAYIKHVNGTFLCGATLLSKQQVGPGVFFSTVSCTDGIPDSDLRIVVGDHNRTSEEGNEQELTIKNSLISDDYNSDTGAYDLKAFYVNENVILNEFVSGITFLIQGDQIKEKILKKRCRVVGWGHQPDGTQGQSDVPIEIVIKINSTCTASATELCFSNARARNDRGTCDIDAGGGVFCKRKRQWYFVGVVTGFNIGPTCTAGERVYLDFFSYYA